MTDWGDIICPKCGGPKGDCYCRHTLDEAVGKVLLALLCLTAVLVILVAVWR